MPTTFDSETKSKFQKTNGTTTDLAKSFVIILRLVIICVQEDGTELQTKTRTANTDPDTPRPPGVNEGWGWKTFSTTADIANAATLTFKVHICVLFHFLVCNRPYCVHCYRG